MTFNKKLLSAAILSCLVCTPSVQAANWLQLQGTEAPNAESVTFFGFVQGQYQANNSKPIGTLQGAAAPYSGRDPVFNLVGPDLNTTAQAQIFRARPGVRGIIPNTNNKINYFVLGELGNNGATIASRPILTDASMTFNHIHGARVRVGVFKAPTGEEALIPVSIMDYLNFSTVTDNLLNERFVKAHSPVAGRTDFAAPAGLTKADMNGNFSGFRDTGIQVFDWFNVSNQWELGYAAMLSRGNGTDWSDRDSNLDTTVRLQASYLLNPASNGAKREDITIYGWKQDGKREFSGQNYDRSRNGFGATYRQGKMRAGAEFVRGKGMIYYGPNIPFNDIGGSAQLPTQTVDLAGEADGYALDAGYNIFHKTWLNVRYDIYNRSTENAALRRDFNTLTTGIQYNFSPTLRLDANYEFRHMSVPNPESLAAGATRNNALLIANSMADRWGMQLTWLY
ncbi:MAG: porin [Thiotrichales bacterium]|jgi:hypothetical protein|nr:porin [Thiotrichales bacterium]